MLGVCINSGPQGLAWGSKAGSVETQIFMEFRYFAMLICITIINTSASMANLLSVHCSDTIDIKPQVPVWALGFINLWFTQWLIQLEITSTFEYHPQ